MQATRLAITVSNAALLPLGTCIVEPSVEGIGDVLRKIVAAIKKFINKIVTGIKKFFGGKERQQKKAEKQLDVLEATVIPKVEEIVKHIEKSEKEFQKTIGSSEPLPKPMQDVITSPKDDDPKPKPTVKHSNLPKGKTHERYVKGRVVKNVKPEIFNPDGLIGFSPTGFYSSIYAYIDAIQEFMTYTGDIVLNEMTGKDHAINDIETLSGIMDSHPKTLRMHVIRHFNKGGSDTFYKNGDNELLDIFPLRNGKMLTVRMKLSAPERLESLHLYESDIPGPGNTLNLRTELPLLDRKMYRSQVKKMQLSLKNSPHTQIKFDMKKFNELVYVVEEYSKDKKSDPKILDVLKAYIVYIRKLIVNTVSLAAGAQKYFDAQFSAWYDYLNNVAKASAISQ